MARAALYVAIDRLPPSVRAALDAVGFGRKDIPVHVHEDFDPRPSSGEGLRGFTAACKLDGTREHSLVWGSWGGANMFTRTVDDGIEGDSAPIPPGIAFVTGHVGGGRPVWASLTVRPDGLDPTLLAAPAVSAREATILACFRALKSSARPEYLSRGKVTPAEIDSLVSRGYLSRNRAGATSITTEGRNASASDYFFRD